jgi:hypothetical protein
MTCKVLYIVLNLFQLHVVDCHMPPPPTFNAEKTHRSQLAAQIGLDDKMKDNDWVFALLIYNKMKEIPEGDDKDDLQIEIQRLVNQTKRSAAALSMPTMPPMCFQPAEYQRMLCPPTPVAGSSCSHASDALSQKSGPN